jgi:lysophospholipase L1-like esterase
VSALRNAVQGWTGNLLLLLGGLAIGLLGAEVITRVVAPQRPTPAFTSPPLIESVHQRDSVFGTVLKSNIVAPFVFGTQVATNSLGLRDREFGPKRNDEFRVLSLGDSYAMGFGVQLEQSYGKVLERDLNRSFPPARFSVINAGVDGYNTPQMCMSFQRLQRLQPDLVLATFVAGNDVYDNAVFEERLRTGVNTPLGLLGRNSQALQLLWKVTFPLWFFLENRDRDNIAHTIDLLRKLEATFRAAHVPYLMLIIPARHQIRPSLEPAVGILMRLGLDSLVFRQNREVIDHFRRDGIPFIDLWPPLVAKDREARVSFAVDSHLNALGHEVVAQEILDRLKVLLPPLLKQSAPKPEPGGRAESSPSETAGCRLAH